MEMRTDRLLLRRWRDSDREPFATMNADPQVMHHFTAPLSREASDDFVDRIEQAFDIWGFGLWAVEVPGVAEFVGFAGLWPVGFDAHFTPAVEVGWRLSADHWGRGYATEAARSALGFGFDGAGLDEIVSFTVPTNTKSVAVMERLGMTHDPNDDFDHPSLPVRSSLRRHVLYRMRAERWGELRSQAAP
jgi:ribosomal-protein-alanine N-acetyltransferase